MDISPNGDYILFGTDVDGSETALYVLDVHSMKATKNYIWPRKDFPKINTSLSKILLAYFSSDRGIIIKKLVYPEEYTIVPMEYKYRISYVDLTILLRRLVELWL